MNQFLVGLAMVAAGLMVAVPAAHASTIFPLTSCHVTAASGSGTDCGTQTAFGTVKLTQAEGNVNFDVVLLGGNRFVETGAADHELFKFNGTGVAVGDIVNAATANPLNAVAGGLQGAAGAFNGDGTGNFGFGIECVISANCNGGSAPVFSELTFTVNGATIAELTVPNNTGCSVGETPPCGNVFVADILIFSNGLTGPVDATHATDGGGGSTQVPGPISLVLMGVGLVVFAAARRGFRHLG
jgi:hypothetical protein